MKRRSFLGAMVAAPAAAPAVVADVAANMGNMPAYPVALSKFHANSADDLKDMKAALAGIDEVPDEYFTGLNGYGDCDPLRSVSPAVKRLWFQQGHAKRERERRKQRLSEQIDEALGKPVASWRKFTRWI